MKIIPAFLTESLRLGVRRPRAQLAAVYAPPPPGYYGDYGPPPRYVLAMGGRLSDRDGQRRRHDPRRDYHYE